jgi:hypothetical protein
MTEIEHFEFEDRKHIQLIITELFNQCPHIITEALYPKRMEVVAKLIDKYPMQGMTAFAGAFLRQYTRSSVNNIIKIRNSCNIEISRCLS